MTFVQMPGLARTETPMTPPRFDAPGGAVPPSMNAAMPAFELWWRASQDATTLGAEWWMRLARCRTPFDAAAVNAEFTEKALRMAMETGQRASAAAANGAGAFEARLPVIE